MNKLIFTHISALIVGGAIGFIIAKQYFKEYYSAIAQEEIDSVRETFKKYKESTTELKSDIIVKGHNEQAKSAIIFDENHGEEAYKRAKEINPSGPLTRSSIEPMNPSEQAKRNYNLIHPTEPEVEATDDEEDADNDDSEDHLEEIAKEITPDIDSIDRSEPYIITEEQYENEFEQHDKVSIYYYLLDDTLCDENQEIMEEIDDTVGWDCFKVLEMQMQCWVRNEPLGIDYEILAVRNSYSQDVLGIRGQNLSPRERYNRKKEKEEDDE